MKKSKSGVSRTNRILKETKAAALLPVAAYPLERARKIYGEAFRLCFEYLHGSKIRGDVLEFGTFRGFSAYLMAQLIKELQYETHLYLFDSFEGLPEASSPVDKNSYEIAMNKRWKKGNMFPGGKIEVLIEKALTKIIPREKLTIVKGFYEDTLDASIPKTKAALINVDCDLYCSAKIVLEKILEKDILQDGCLLLLDDYNCNRANPNMGERRALRETLGSQRRFTYSPFFSYGWHGQAFFIHDTSIKEIKP